MIRLHFRIAVAKRSGNGTAYVSAATGRPADLGTSAQIVFKTRRASGGLQMQSDSLGLIGGRVVRLTRSLSREVRFANYIPFRGVVPGENVMTVQLEQYDQIDVEELEIFEDSGLELSSRGPASFRVRATVEPGVIGVGRDVRVRVRVESTAGHASGPTPVEVRYPATALRLRGRALRHVRDVDAGRDARLDFVFTALRDGRHDVAVRAFGAVNTPTARVSVAVADGPAGTGEGRTWLWALVSLPLLAGGAYWILRGRQRATR